MATSCLKIHNGNSIKGLIVHFFTIQVFVVRAVMAGLHFESREDDGKDEKREQTQGITRRQE